MVSKPALSSLSIEYYENNTVTAPKKHYYDRFVKDYKRWAEVYFDYVHYRVPLNNVHQDGYRFDSQYVGQTGVWDTLKRLHQNDPAYKSRIQDHSIQLSNGHFGSDIAKMVRTTRGQFRAKHKIDDSDFVIFFSPGNRDTEVEWSFDHVQKGIDEFLLKYSAPTSLSPIAAPLEKFHVVISIDETSESAQMIRDKIDQSVWRCNYTVVDDHIDAMAAADVGIAYDGQLISSAAACQLPTMSLINFRKIHHWYHDLFNRWWSDMNIIADKNITPEIIGGELWFGKVTDTLGEWYVKPQLRYDAAKQFEYFVKDALPIKETSPDQNQFSDKIVPETQDHLVEYHDPLQLIATKLWEDIQEYNLKESKAPSNYAGISKGGSIPNLF